MNYTTFQILEILHESRRNMATAVTLVNQNCFDIAAKNLEMAAEKLHIVQKEYDQSIIELGKTLTK